MSGVILSDAALDFWRMAVLRNGDSDVTTTDLRTYPGSKSPDSVIFFMHAREVPNPRKAYGFSVVFANPEQNF